MNWKSKSRASLRKPMKATNRINKHLIDGGEERRSRFKVNSWRVKGDPEGGGIFFFSTHGSPETNKNLLEDAKKKKKKVDENKKREGERWRRKASTIILRTKTFMLLRHFTRALIKIFRFLFRLNKKKNFKKKIFKYLNVMDLKNGLWKVSESEIILVENSLWNSYDSFKLFESFFSLGKFLWKIFQ